MSLPPVDRAALPADIRTASPERRDAYTSALAFEQLLTQQLAETMLPKGGAAGAYASMMPQALADGLTAAGGLGLARPLADSLVPPTRIAPAPRPGATS